MKERGDEKRGVRRGGGEGGGVRGRSEVRERGG